MIHESFFSIRILLCALAATFAVGAKAQTSLPTIGLTAQVQAEPPTGLPRMVSGRMRIEGWRPEGGHCLYLPFNDPDYGDDRGTQRRLEMFSDRQAKVVFDQGSTLITGVPSTGYIVKLDLPVGYKAPIELSFASSLPRLPSSSDDDWFFESFYPQPLRSCADADFDDPEIESIYQRGAIAAHIKAQIKLPDGGWLYAGPGKPESSASNVIQIDTNGRNLAFALGRAYQQTSFVADGVPVKLHYHTENFTELIPTIKTALEVQQNLFGRYPFETLTIVETTELQRHGLPGLVAVNVPHQAVFSKVQKDWLNWQHWMITTQLAMQWLGGSVHVRNPDDEWLLAGGVEFATLETLRRLPQRYNLFNVTSEGYRLLSFDYLQISEISAATLQRYAPFFVLTTSELKTALPFRQQPGLGFVKHAFALRQLKSFAGELPFYGFFRNFTHDHAFQAVTPEDFYHFINKLPSPFSPPLRRSLQSFLSRWWMDEGFPDFALSDFTKEQLPDGRWLAKIAAGQLGGIDFPPVIGLKDASDRTYFVRAEKPRKEGDQDAAAAWLAEIITPYEPRRVNVDPGHEAFDVDRFNNKSGLPAVQFFPGAAATLNDDAYTVIWLPYVFRRPGEPTSVGVQAVLFRFIQGGLVLRAETAPQEKLGAFELRQRYFWLPYALTGDLSFAQSYDNDRLAEASIIRSPLFAEGPNLNVNLRLRHHETVGQKATRHQSGVVGGGLRPSATGGRCDYNLSVNYEYAPASLAEDFSYERRTGLALGNCNVLARTDFSMRLFVGKLTHQGEVPLSAYFKPTELREARLRLDLRGLARVSKIAALGTDLLLPFTLPLPADSLILTRQMRWRLFYDYGRGQVAINQSENQIENRRERQAKKDIEYRATGLGFLLPLGGDLSGAGSLALTRLSLLAVLHSNAAGQVSKKPGILFDITGEL